MAQDIGSVGNGNALILLVFIITEVVSNSGFYRVTEYCFRIVFLIVYLSILSGYSMLLLGELLGMKSSRSEERNSESEFILSV